MEITLVKKYLPYLLIIVITLVVSGIFVKKSDFLKNKEIKTLEQSNKKLEEENVRLQKEAEESLQKYQDREKDFNRIKNQNDTLTREIQIRNKYVILMKGKLDSLNIDIKLSDSILIKIDKEEYEILNNSSSSSINEHDEFFTKFLESKDNSR